MRNQHARVLLPSHFDPACFTVAAYDNFAHLDKNSLSGMEDSHDTAITVRIKKIIICKGAHHN